MASHDPHGYLDTSARIIAENDVHAVVALRVEKSWLEQNLSFFAALADAAARIRKKERAERD